MALTTLSIRLKHLRESHNLTQNALGKYLNISRQGYSHYEKGTRVPDFNTLERLADLYGLTMDELLAEPDANGHIRKSVRENTPTFPIVEGVTSQERLLLNLFAQLPDIEKEDFIDLVSIKVHQCKVRHTSRTKGKK